MLGDSLLDGRPARFTLSRTPESYWPSWLVSLAGGCPKKIAVIGPLPESFGRTKLLQLFPLSQKIAFTTWKCQKPEARSNFADRND